MIRRFQGQPAQQIRDLFHDVVERIMAQHNIEPLQEPPDHVVRSDANYPEVVQNTDWYCWRGDTRPPYRYRRYREILGYMQPEGRREAHVDIGCGAGLFSWAFLDWAHTANLAYDRVALYGLDHSPEMINLAHHMRDGLLPNVAHYPELHYSHDIDAFLQELTKYHRAGTDYTITFGHVLVQASHPDAIRSFARMILHVLGLLDDQANCALIAVDAQGWSHSFVSAWNLLLSNLTQSGVRYEQIEVRGTSINDDSRAKIAWLSPANRQGG